ncbi:hypothetical protein CoNPh32_CDS0015 [Staphylococcus phage S-CoN_Ph32]|nr:hypothetical protein CoNPh32_CDS0015 [Staphylococcus phage S-CoN_Ph32]
MLANTILAWGGKIDGKGGSSSGSSHSGSPSGGIDVVARAFEEFLKKLQDSMQWDLHSIGTDKFFQIRCSPLPKHTITRIDSI